MEYRRRADVTLVPSVQGDRDVREIRFSNTSGVVMPRIVVTLDSVGAELRRPYMMDEEVDPVHLEDEHASLALIQHLAWAIEAAKQAERTREPYPAALHGARGLGISGTPE